MIGADDGDDDADKADDGDDINERKMIVSVLGIHRPFPHHYS